jgi:glucose-6-phosphate dehydrogenase assembly protein OpcA
MSSAMNPAANAQMPMASMRPVDLNSVEKELDAMWREVNASNVAAGGHAFARNSVLTLVVYTSGAQGTQRVIGAVHQLTTQHPSRAIVISADPKDQGQAVQAFVGTVVDTASYGEDIVIAAQSEAVRHLPGVVLPLIVSGLPSFLWWTGEPPWGTELLEALVDGSDRFVVDTSETENVEQTIGALDDLVRRKKTRCAVSDVTWTAQAPWREIVAQFFDGSTTRPYLSGIERVTLEYAAGDEFAPTNSSQVHLFAGWLASRLGWRVAQTPHGRADENRQYTLRDALNHNVTLEVNARYGVPQQSWWMAETQQRSTPWVRHGSLMSVHIASRVEGNRATFTVARERDLAHATTLCQVPGATIPSQTVHLQSIGEREVLADQLRTLGHDAVYEDALGAASQLLGTTTRRSNI